MTTDAHSVTPVGYGYFMNVRQVTDDATETLTFWRPKTRELPKIPEKDLTTPLYWTVARLRGVDEGHVIASEIIKGEP